MDIIDKLNDQTIWQTFWEYKSSSFNMRKKDLDDLHSFIEKKEYSSEAELLRNGGELGIPTLLEIEKEGTNKKRIVFTFDRKRNYILKLMAFILRDYDYLFSENLYSFRNNTGAKKAAGRIRESLNIEKAYSYKVDIHDYFNSIDTDKMVVCLSEHIPDEKPFIEIMNKMWNDPRAWKKHKIISIKKGVMAGTPTACFMANLYLAKMDNLFWEKNILYARYSDDIIVFAYTEEKIKEYEKIIKDYLYSKGLKVNEKKEFRTKPGEIVDFLGFEFSDKVDISKKKVKAVKGKLKRKARALYRWKIRKEADNERTARAFIRFLNQMFYEDSIDPESNEHTWCNWYFPIIQSDRRLKEIDAYAVQCLRYLYTGKYGKSNYRLRYNDIKEMGFNSLVNSFWKTKKEKRE